MLLTWEVWLANNASLHFRCFGVLQPCGKLFWPCNICIFMVFERSNLKQIFLLDWWKQHHTYTYTPYILNHTCRWMKMTMQKTFRSLKISWYPLLTMLLGSVCVRNVNVHTVQMHFIQAHMQEHKFYVHKVLVLLHHCRGTVMVVAIRKCSRCSVSIRNNSAITFTVESDTMMSRYELIVWRAAKEAFHLESRSDWQMLELQHRIHQGICRLWIQRLPLLVSTCSY